ncbi:hypothetical protein ElyMa_005767100 [Elysia marginata]|uniref:Uncharacterized protein n=1 Tax=Elysia marginata TaxID=1093978 RepID=A0AAV4FPF4_9GAST|nr:hypothetical protein ElyMa_005767100 [Elysia marginata]
MRRCVHMKTVCSHWFGEARSGSTISELHQSASVTVFGQPYYPPPSPSSPCQSLPPYIISVNTIKNARYTASVKPQSLAAALTYSLSAPPSSLSSHTHTRGAAPMVAWTDKSQRARVKDKERGGGEWGRDRKKKDLDLIRDIAENRDEWRTFIVEIRRGAAEIVRSDDLTSKRLW